MHDAYMRCQEGRFPRPALTNGRPGTGLLANSRQVLMGITSGKVAAQTHQAQNGISCHVQAAQPDRDESRGAKCPPV
jgi:hypothetical protein